MFRRKSGSLERHPPKVAHRKACLPGDPIQIDVAVPFCQKIEGPLSWCEDATPLQPFFERKSTKLLKLIHQFAGVHLQKRSQSSWPEADSPQAHTHREKYLFPNRHRSHDPHPILFIENQIHAPIGVHSIGTSVATDLPDGINRFDGASSSFLGDRPARSAPPISQRPPKRSPVFPNDPIGNRCAGNWGKRPATPILDPNSYVHKVPFPAS